MIRFRCMLIVIALLSALFSGGCGNKGGKLQEIRITPQHRMIATGTQEQFNSLAVFGDGTMLNWTSATNWSTSDVAVQISNEFNTYGLAVSIRSATSGTIIITGKDLANNVVSTATLSVVDPTSLSIYPPNAYMKAKTSHPFRCETLLSSDPTVTPQVLTSLCTWTTDNPQVATVTKGGYVFALLTGTTNLTSAYTYTKFDSLSSQPTLTSITGTTTITVTATELASLTLTSSPSVTGQPSVIIAPGTVQFGASGHYNGEPDQVFTESVTWHSSNQKVATISDNPGSKGLCRLWNPGSTIIRATDPVTGRSAAVTMIVQ